MFKTSSSFAKVSGDDQQPVRVMVRNHGRQRVDGALSRLISFFRLDVYGPSLLGRRARVELELIAVLLLLVLVFDLSAWTLLVNTFLHAKILAVDRWTLVALLVGAIPTLIVVFYERQFYTVDVWEGWRARVRIGMFLRVVVIIAAAVCTAQPVELLLFKQAIDERAHEEGVRLELVSRLQEVDRIQEDLLKLDGRLTGVALAIDQEVEGREYSASKKVYDETLIMQAQLEAAKARASGNIGHWKGQVAERLRLLEEIQGEVSARAMLSSLADEGAAEITAARQRVESALASQRAWEARLSKAENGLREVEVELPVIAKRISSARERLGKRRNELEEGLRQQVEDTAWRRERIERWIGYLRTFRPGDPEPIRERPNTRSPAFSDTDSESPLGLEMDAAELPVELWSYHFPKYSFFRQLRVLKDLREGHPPAWDGLSAARLEELSGTYGLEYVRPCFDGEDALGKPCDLELWQQHERQTSVYRWSYRVVYLVALIVPMLVMAMKLLMPAELSAYYSNACQMEFGNADAITVNEVQRRAWRSSEEGRVDTAISPEPFAEERDQDAI